MFGRVGLAIAIVAAWFCVLGDPHAQVSGPVGESIGASPVREPIADSTTPAIFDGVQERLPFTNFEVGDFVFEPADVWAVEQSTGAHYLRHSLLVQFESGLPEHLRAQALNTIAARPIRPALPGGWQAVETAEDAQNALRTLSTRAGVVAASLNYRAGTLQQRPNDEFYRFQWNFDALNLPLAWEINPGASNDITVAIVDSGVNVATQTFTFRGPFGRSVVRFAATPDLIETGRIASPWDFVYGDGLPFDLDGHGTHVAGTVGQLTDNQQGLAGIAYNVKLMPVKVIPGDWDYILSERLRPGAADVIAEGVRYAVDHGAHIVNLSLRVEGPSAPLRDALRYAVDHGTFVSVAAGNFALDGNPDVYPAAYGSEIEGVITVGAVNRTLHRAEYSTHKPYVEICAPGGENGGDSSDYERGVTQVTYSDASTLMPLSRLNKAFAFAYYRFRPRFDTFVASSFQGTSMAAPHVAGIAALLYGQGIRDPRSIEEAIKQFAQPIDATPDECGAGLVDPRRTLRGLGLAR